MTFQPFATMSAGSLFFMDVAAEDSFGNLARTFNGTVSPALANNPGAATLGGTLSVTASAGNAEFTGLAVNTAAAGYTLIASSPGLTSVTSTPFTVNAGPVSQLVVTTEPPASVVTNAPFGIAVAAEDSVGNIITTYSGPMTIAGGGIATTTVFPTGGVATFTGLSLPYEGQTELNVSSGSLSVNTTSIIIQPTAAAQQVLMAQPGYAQATATAAISGGAVAAITVTSGGGGYRGAPSVILIGGAFTTAATATAVLGSGPPRVRSWRSTSPAARAIRRPRS